MKIKYLGVQDYCSTSGAMKKKIAEGLAEDELWILEHFPVYTIGVNKKISVYLILKFPSLNLIGEERLLIMDRVNLSSIL